MAKTITLRRRLLEYGTASLVAGTLLWAAFYRASADLGTLMSSIRMQLQMAYAIPPVDKHGVPLSQRESMLSEIEHSLDQAEALAPRLAAVAEFRGFLHMLRSEWRTAAADYHRARGLDECDIDQRDTLVFNEARMLQKARDPEAALLVFTANKPQLEPHLLSQCEIESAALLHELGRDPESLALLQGLLAGDEQDPTVLVQAGQQFEALGRLDLADTAFTRAAVYAPVVDYHRSRLKMRSGEVDKALELLQRAAKAASAEVQRLADNDRAVWQAVADDERFSKLLGPRPPAGTPAR